MNKILRYAQDDNVILTVFLIKLALMRVSGGEAGNSRSMLRAC